MPRRSPAATGIVVASINVPMLGHERARSQAPDSFLETARIRATHAGEGAEARLRTVDDSFFTIGRSQSR